MITATQIAKKQRSQTNLLSLALLELLTFTIMLCLIWLNEVNDYTLIYFGVKGDCPNVYRGYILSAATIICAIISIGNTHLNAKHVIKGMLIICANCKKIKLNTEDWTDIEQYIFDKSLATLRHGICPECAAKTIRHTVEANIDGDLTGQQGETAS